MIDVEALDRDSARVFAMTFDPLIRELGTVTNVDGDIVVPTDRFPFKLAQQLRMCRSTPVILGPRILPSTSILMLFKNLGVELNSTRQVIRFLFWEDTSS